MVAPMRNVYIQNTLYIKFSEKGPAISATGKRQAFHRSVVDPGEVSFTLTHVNTDGQKEP